MVFSKLPILIVSVSSSVNKVILSNKVVVRTKSVLHAVRDYLRNIRFLPFFLPCKMLGNDRVYLESVRTSSQPSGCCSTTGDLGGYQPGGGLLLCSFVGFSATQQQWLGEERCHLLWDSSMPQQTVSDLPWGVFHHGAFKQWKMTNALRALTGYLWVPTFSDWCKHRPILIH